MDNDKQIQPQVIFIKKVDEDGYDEEGVLHENCGTPECCGGCETAEEE